jgi:polysaccharide export outer membrane protein
MKHLFALALVSFILSVASPSRAQEADYVVGSQDVLTITVYDQADLSGKFKVEADGMFTFPLVGRIKAAGVTLHAIENDLKAKLADGYIKNPQVTVAVETFQSQRIFILGEVRQPGPYVLTGDMTIIEALARAGSVTPTAADEILIVRPPPGRAAGPVMPEQAGNDVNVIRINIRDLQEGNLAKNVLLKDGDTIVVPKAHGVYVFGQVKTPGAYAMEKGTTVLQALSLAGGVTDRGSTGRVKIVRSVDGKKTELKAKLTDLVEPGDTLIVGERFF